MTTYFGFLRRDEGTAYGVDFPDFPGCIAAGDTPEDAMRLGEEALNFHIRGMLEDGEAIPLPTPLDRLVLEPRDPAGILLAFPARSHHRPKGRAVRTNVTIEEGLLAEIDAFIAPRKLSRSAFLAAAAEKALAQRFAAEH